jgi:hypothetical protein
VQRTSGDNEVHEHIVMSTGDAGYLAHEFLHYAYPDLSAWIEKHNRYTTWEAHAAKAGDVGAVNASLFESAISQRVSDADGLVGAVVVEGTPSVELSARPIVHPSATRDEACGSVARRFNNGSADEASPHDPHR